MSSITKKAISPSASGGLSPNKSINLKGEVCPYTFVKTKLALEEMSVGEVLEVIVDHEPAVENVPRSIQNEGQKVLAVEKLNDTDGATTWRLVIKKEKD
ncbi:MAG: sulfurtransferase TusA family protein [Candidatus Brocadiaceae bacterium]|nr:sulfurtransferase TusA family protein [Candidatus Brocadiaceae bacterium]